MPWQQTHVQNIIILITLYIFFKPHCIFNSGRWYYDIISISDNDHILHPQRQPIFLKCFIARLKPKTKKGQGWAWLFVKIIMDIHGGFIHTESIPAEGANFYCYFPNDIDQAGLQ